MFCLKTMIFSNAQHSGNPETILLVVDNAKSPTKPVSFQSKRTYLSRDVPEYPPPPPPQASDSSNESWSLAGATSALPPLVRVSASPRIGSSRKSSPRIRSNRKSSQPRQSTSRVSTSPRTTARKDKKSPSFRRSGSHDCIISETIASTMHALEASPPSPPAEERWQSTPTFRSPSSNKKTFRRSGSHDGISEAMKNPPRRTARRRFSASNDRWSASPCESPPRLAQTNQSPHTKIFFRKSINDNAEKTLSKDRKVGGLLVSPLATSSPSKPVRRSSRNIQYLPEHTPDTTTNGQTTRHHSLRQPVRQRSRPKIHEEAAGSEMNRKPVPPMAADPHNKSPLHVEEKLDNLTLSSLPHTSLTSVLRQGVFLSLQSSVTRAKSVSNEENRTL